MGGVQENVMMTKIRDPSIVMTLILLILHILYSNNKGAPHLLQLKWGVPHFIMMTAQISLPAPHVLDNYKASSSD